MFKMLCALALEFQEKVFGGGGLGGHKGCVGHCWSDLDQRLVQVITMLAVRAYCLAGLPLLHRQDPIAMGWFKYKAACITISQCFCA